MHVQILQQFILNQLSYVFNTARNPIMLTLRGGIALREIDDEKEISAKFISAKTDM